MLVLRSSVCNEQIDGGLTTNTLHGDDVIGLKKRNWRDIKDLAYFSSLGLQVALSIFIGYGIGNYLDAKFQTNPWLTIIFFLLGIAAAFRNIGLAIKKLRNF